jgi:hypothetical protein
VLNFGKTKKWQLGILNFFTIRDKNLIFKGCFKYFSFFVSNILAFVPDGAKHFQTSFSIIASM